MTTFKIGGPARYFCEAGSIEDIREGVAFARSRNLPLFVLGGGSNILVSDRGYSGLVMRITDSTLTWEEKENMYTLTAGAGVSWDTLVGCVVSHDVSGIENLSAIPGTVGGAVVQNIGAYGSEVKDCVLSVEVYDPSENCVRTLTRRECNFAYRTSIFKEEGKKFIIMRVQFCFQKEKKINISYKDLITHFELKKNIHPTLTEIRDAVTDIRSKKFPDLSRYGTAGSYFKNPIVSNVVANNFLLRYPLAPVYDAGEGAKKLSAAWIIDHILNMRGHRVGAVGSWSAQALVIVNYGDASCAEVTSFVREIQSYAKKICAITLLAEVILIDE